MTQTHGPLDVRPEQKNSEFHVSKAREAGAYTVPESVDGGASKSGFCISIGMFWGPRIVEPVEPRIGAGTMSVALGLHKTSLGSSLARITVELGIADDEVEVPTGSELPEPDAAGAAVTDK